MDILGPEEKMFSSKHCLSKYTADPLKLFDVCHNRYYEKKIGPVSFFTGRKSFSKICFPIDLVGVTELNL